MLFVVTGVCCCFVLLVFSQCLLATRVGVLGHRRGTALGHPSRMPHTGANITVVLLKTWRDQDSTYTEQPSVVGLSGGMMVKAVIYSCDVLCCCCRSCCYKCMLPPRLPKTL